MEYHISHLLSNCSREFLPFLKCFCMFEIILKSATKKSMSNKKRKSTPLPGVSPLAGLSSCGRQVSAHVGRLVGAGDRERGERDTTRENDHGVQQDQPSPRWRRYRRPHVPGVAGEIETPMEEDGGNAGIPWQPGDSVYMRAVGNGAT